MRKKLLATAMICIAALPAPAYAGLLFHAHAEHSHGLMRRLAGGALKRGAEVMAGDMALHAGVAVFSAESILAACRASGCGANALSEIQALKAKHPLAGDKEVAHAMTKKVENHPETLETVQTLANEAGIKVDLSKKASSGAKARVAAMAALEARDADTFPGSNMKSPGDCDNETIEILNRDVEKFCKAKGGDEEGGVAPEFTSNVKACKDNNMVPLSRRREEWTPILRQAKLCADARQNIMEGCFRGGDKGHAIELQKILNIIDGCQELLGVDGKTSIAKESKFMINKGAAP